MHGRVKVFDMGKGYGFIRGDDGKEYLVYFTAVRTKGGQLREDDEVEFEAMVTPKGPQAAEVRRVREE